MKLKDAIEIAKDCGLETIGEAIYNIKIHAGSIFNYGEEIAEFKELWDEFKETNYTLDTRIDEIRKE